MRSSSAADSLFFCTSALRPHQASSACARRTSSDIFRTGAERAASLGARGAAAAARVAMVHGPVRHAAAIGAAARPKKFGRACAPRGRRRSASFFAAAAPRGGSR